VEEWKAINGFYPTTNAFTTVLLDQPYAAEITRNGNLIRDPWGWEYQYTRDSPKKYTLFSLGPDDREDVDDILP